MDDRAVGAVGTRSERYLLRRCRTLAAREAHRQGRRRDPLGAVVVRVRGRAWSVAVGFYVSRGFAPRRWG